MACQGPVTCQGGGWGVRPIAWPIIIVPLTSVSRHLWQVPGQQTAKQQRLQYLSVHCLHVQIDQTEQLV